MSEFSYLSGDFFQQASFQPSRHSGLLLTGAWETIAGPWLQSAVSRLKARLTGRIHQDRPCTCWADHSVCRERQRWCSDVFGCRRSWWLNPVLRTSHGGARGGPSQTRECSQHLLGRGSFPLSPARVCRRTPGTRLEAGSVCARSGMTPRFLTREWLSPVPYCMFTETISISAKTDTVSICPAHWQGVANIIHR